VTALVVTARDWRTRIRPGRVRTVPQQRAVLHMDSGRIEQLQYDGWNLIEERDENDALTKTHVHGPEVDEIVTTIRSQDPTPLYHHHDGLGSVIALTTTNAVPRYFQWDKAGS